MKKKYLILSVFLLLLVIPFNIPESNAITIQYFNNGGFEVTSLYPYWTIADSWTYVSSVVKHSGVYSCRIEGGRAGNQWVKQMFVSTPVKEDVTEWYFWIYCLDVFAFYFKIYYNNGTDHFIQQGTGTINGWKKIVIHNATHNLGFGDIPSGSKITGLSILDDSVVDVYLDDFFLYASIPQMTVESNPELNAQVYYYRVLDGEEHYSQPDTPFTFDISSGEYYFRANEIFKENSTGTVFKFAYFSINYTANYTDWEIEIYISSVTTITLYYTTYEGAYTTERDKIDFLIGLIGAILFCINPILSYKMSNDFKDKFKFFFIFFAIFIISFGLIMSFIYRGS